MLTGIGDRQMATAEDHTGRSTEQEHKARRDTMKLRMLNTTCAFGSDRDGVYGFRWTLDFGQRKGKHSRGSILVHRNTPVGQEFFEVVPKKGRRVVYYAGPSEERASRFLDHPPHSTMAEVRKKSLVSEDRFEVARGGEGKDVVLIKRGKDNTDRVLLFVGQRDSNRGKVSIFEEETTGMVLQACIASSEKESAAEVAVILKPDQTIAFRVKNDHYNSDTIFIYAWDGEDIALRDRRSWREWKAAKDMDELVETGNLKVL